jgi:hypothetical protein
MRDEGSCRSSKQVHAAAVGSLPVAPGSPYWTVLAVLEADGWEGMRRLSARKEKVGFSELDAAYWRAAQMGSR